MQDQNSVYAPPKSVVRDLTQQTISPHVDFVQASQWRRFFNMMIDSVGYYLLAIVLGVLLYVLGIFDENSFPEGKSNPLMDWILGSIVFSFYYIPLEHFTGKTLGKLITGTRVVDANGQKPTFKQIALRTLIRVIPFEPFTFLGPTGRGFHDKWTDTYVIKTRK